MKKMIQTVLLQLISLVLLTIANPATASEWPMFRANPLRTGTIETKNANSKVTLSGEKDWSLKISHSIQSSPAIYENAIIFGSDDGYIYSLDAKNKNLNWSFYAENWVVSSPSILDGKVFVGSYNGKMYCLDAKTGRMI